MSGKLEKRRVDADFKCPTKIRVVVVDDHPLLRDSIKNKLTEHGFDVVGAAKDCDEASHLVEEFRPDVVTLDIVLYPGSGFEAIPMIVRLAPSVRIVMFSVHEDIEFCSTALSLGAHGYVTKSTDFVELVRGINEVFRGNKYVSPVIGGRKDMTRVERYLLELLAKGLEIQTIAAQLGVSVENATRQVGQLRAKLHKGDAKDLVRFAKQFVQVDEAIIPGSKRIPAADPKRGST